jgi:prepilin-type N-terminal cleavage/methylation domain-containing protein
MEIVVVPMKGDCVKSTRNRGYTIVELMIVVVIIAIGATMAAASIMEARKNSILTSVARETFNLLETARSRALMRNVAVGIVVNNAVPTATTLALSESFDTSCNRIAGVGTEPIDTLKSNMLILDLTFPRYRTVTGANVYTKSLLINGIASAGATLCINRRGRVLMLGGSDWVNITTAPAFRITYQRRDDGIDVGVERIVELQQGGVPRIVQ